MDWIKGRPNTIKVKTCLFNNWVKPHLSPDGSNLDSVVSKWEADLQPSTTKSLLYIAKEWVKYETGTELEVKAHITRVGRSKQQLPIQTLTREEISTLTAACEADDEHLHLAVMLGLHLGLRRGEAFGLQYGDVDLLRGRVTISRSYSSTTKSGKSRIIPLSSEMESLIVANLGWKSYNEGKAKRSDNVLPVTFDPNPRLRRVAKKAGMRTDFTYHTLRHTFATMALESGRSPKLVSQALGHSSLVTTLSCYWNVVGESLDMGFLSE